MQTKLLNKLKTVTKAAISDPTPENMERVDVCKAFCRTEGIDDTQMEVIMDSVVIEMVND